MQRSTRTFVRFFLLLACMAQSNAGLAFPPFGNEAAEVARLHCQLLLRQAGDSRPLTEKTIDTMVGVKDFHSLLGGPPQQLAQFTGDAPEFGFVIGVRWLVMDRWERMEFNRLFSQALIRDYAIQATQDYANTCPMSARLLELEAHTLPTEKKEEPQADDWLGGEGEGEAPPRPMAAFASSILPVADKPPLEITYYLEKRPPAGWEIQEITLGKDELSLRYGQQFNDLLATGGTTKLFEYLKNSPPAVTKP